MKSKKFVPYEKLSKKQKREINSRKRGTWGTINPATRIISSKKAFNKKAERANGKREASEYAE